jgi:hypothetical protein
MDGRPEKLTVPLGPRAHEKQPMMPSAGRMKKFIFRRFFGINKRSFHYEMDKKSVLSQLEKDGFLKSLRDHGIFLLIIYFFTRQKNGKIAILLSIKPSPPRIGFLKLARNIVEFSLRTLGFKFFNETSQKFVMLGKSNIIVNAFVDLP